MDLSNACAVISGGASGLGRAVATRVISAGGKACLLDINADQGAATAAELGDHATFVQTDVTDEKAVEAGIAASCERMGRVSLAVSCAGVIGAGRVLGREGPMPGEQFARTIAINLLGTFYLVKASAAAMENNEAGVERGTGRDRQYRIRSRIRGTDRTGGLLRVERRRRRHDATGCS